MIDISVSNLSKEFEVGKKILDGLTFQVDQGERVGLLGKNGAGKTTPIKAALGIIAADEGAVITAFASGTVTAVGDSAELGNYVTVQHEGGFATLYAHCSRITASSGQQVALGDPIAEVGETGNATGPHLHFALQKDTVYLDPAYYGIG